MIVDLIFLLGVGSISTAIRNKLSGEKKENVLLMLFINSFFNLLFVYLTLRIFDRDLLIADATSSYRINVGLFSLIFAMFYSVLIGFIEAYIDKVIEIKIGVKNG